MPKKPNLDAAYRDERRRTKGMSDAELNQRRADLEATFLETGVATLVVASPAWLANSADR